jgi:CRP-like cAMP-binding protein
VSGDVRQYDISDEGDKIVLNVFQRPAFIPMPQAINGTLTGHFFETMTDAQMYKAPAKDVVDFLHKDPEVTFDLLKRVFAGTETLLKRMSYAMGGSAQDRIVYELLLDARRFGHKQSDGSTLVTTHVYELAARTGLSRETASRQLSKLRNLGVTNSRKGITLKNLKALEEKLGI